MKRPLRCVLLIDDDEPTNFLNQLLIEESGCVQEVRVMQSALDALDYLFQRGQYEHAADYLQPELIFLDINMPAMDGWEFLEQYMTLRSDQRSHVVVMLTTSFSPDDMQKAQGIECVCGFKNKPLTLEMFMDIIAEQFPEAVSV